MNKIIGDRTWGYLLLIASLSCIFAATLSPFEFVIPEGFSGQFIIQEFNFGSSIKDYLQNILLFIPLGISLGVIITPIRQQFWIILIFSILVSAILSTTIELTQFFLIPRVSNLTDIIYNSLGGALGVILYYWRINIIRFIIAILTGNLKRLSLKVLLLTIGGYCSIVILGILLLLISVNLNNWDNDYYLAIGNEVTGDRPWNGNINSLYICDRSLDESQVTKGFKYKDDFFAQLPSLITSLVFFEQQNFYQDRSQHVPNLSWQNILSLSKNNNSLYQVVANRNNEKNQDKTILVNHEHWLRTEDSAFLLNKKIKNANEFTLSLIVATNKIDQRGPARIMALSGDIYAQNMTIGQEGRDLNFRLRTPITGNNPTHPEFIIPNIFTDHNLHQILITYAQKKLTFYIDKPDNQYSFKFNLFTSFFVYFPWDKKRWKINLEDFNILKYQLLFYTIIIVPFGILIITLLYYLLVNYLAVK